MAFDNRISIDVTVSGDVQKQIDNYVKSFDSLRNSINGLSQPFNSFSNNINLLDRNLSKYTESLSKLNDQNNTPLVEVCNFDLKLRKNSSCDNI
jgi:uncharacterized phage infection (PIP) family protein YhgE